MTTCEQSYSHLSAQRCWGRPSISNGRHEAHIVNQSAHSPRTAETPFRPSRLRCKRLWYRTCHLVPAVTKGRSAVYSVQVRRQDLGRLQLDCKRQDWG